ncbi:MAG: hypothetical protein Q4C98_02195 [Capnocytophaga sp.]|nr:hypothetical protein [Capnocytophaga sp.]
MKRNFIYAVLVVIISAAVGCVEITPVYDNLQVSTSEITVEAQDEATFEITSGSGNYSVNSNNQAIVTATLSGTTVVVNGVQEGESTVVVVDNTSKQEVSVKVIVQKLVPRIIFKTAKAIGQDFTLGLVGASWIDLNNNGVKDDNENIPEPFEYLHDPNIDPDRLSDAGNAYKFTVHSQTITIYGDVKHLNFWNHSRETWGRGKNNLPLISLEIKGEHPHLEILQCGESGLSELSTVNMPNLRVLDCRDNNLKKLEVNKSSKIYLLYCSNNNLSSLNVSNLTELKYLECDNNMLTSLDVRNCKSLYRLYCNNNQLTSLLVSPDASNAPCHYLSSIRCYENKIKGKAMTDFIKNLPAGIVTYERGTYKDINTTRWLVLSYISATEQNDDISSVEIDLLVKRYWFVYTKGKGYGEQLDPFDFDHEAQQFPCGYFKQ